MTTARPARQLATARARELLARDVDGDPLEVWLEETAPVLTVGEQAAALGVQRRRVQKWRAPLHIPPDVRRIHMSAAGRLSAASRAASPRPAREPARRASRPRPDRVEALARRIRKAPGPEAAKDPARLELLRELWARATRRRRQEVAR